MNVYIPYTRLPAEYQEVEYIQSSGTQYIDTWYWNSNWVYVDMELEYTSTPSLQVIFWAEVWSWELQRLHVWATTKHSIWSSTAEVSWWSVQANTRYVYNASFVAWTWASLYVNNTLTASTSTTWYSSANLFIFAWNLRWSAAALWYMKLYYLKIYTPDKSTLVRDFIPCYRKSDSVIWLYDLVNNQFYTNSWTGTFSKGNDVTMSVLKNIYIGEYGWKPWANTIAYYPLETDTNDYSWNNRNWTNNWVTFSDWLWVFNGSSYISLGTGSWTNIQTNMTISVWFRWNWSWSKDNMVVAKSQYYAPWTWYSNYAFYAISIHEEDRYLMAWFYNQSDFNAHPLNFRTTWWWSPTLWPVSQSNKWYHVVITNDWTTKKAYIDWTLVATETNTSTSSTQSVDTRIGSAVRYNYDSYFNWNISKVIFEDKTWSADEVSEYYNNTKSNYWL